MNSEFRFLSSKRSESYINPTCIGKIAPSSGRRDDRVLYFGIALCTSARLQHRHLPRSRCRLRPYHRVNFGCAAL